ncbi:hypothetical protein CB0940_06427 [Cercospora beticola]|nr:hypothetical protein CB0940_06427 [Cercospora beticola]PIA97833.1 hypothetical protein CB0940_06427 [Cercospora beticola]
MKGSFPSKLDVGASEDTLFCNRALALFDIMAPPGPSKAKPAPPAAKQDSAPVAGQGASQPVNPTALTAVIDKEKELAAEKQDAMNTAVARFKEISTSLGGHQQAKAFFDTYGTDGFKPKAPPEDPKRIAPKEMTLNSEIKDYTHVQDLAWDIEEPDKAVNATELNDEAWQHLIDTTKMLHGYVLNGTSGLSRARFQAFQLKPPAGNTYKDAKTIRPEFEVFDASSISTKETKTQVERSMAQNGFSSQAISASVGASTPYVGVGVSASHSSESQKSESSADFKDRLEYTATYNFPRARIFLDELNLEATTECADFLVKIEDAANKISANIKAGKEPDQDRAVANANRLVAQFYTRFGHIFACNIQLGGQLTASKSATSFGTVKEEERRDAMQAAVAASVETKAVSVSSSYSKGTSTDDTNRNTTVENASSLAWSARGGNTLLCANPAAWANSVADPKHWRVMEQANILALPELISKFTRTTHGGALAWPNIGGTFHTIAKSKFQQIPRIQPDKWTGKLKFRTLDGRKVVIKDNHLCIADEGEEAIFSVLDADKEKSHDPDTIMPQLYADSPVYLMPGKPCRWTLRRNEALPDKTAPLGAFPWAPGRGDPIKHEEVVGLFCHSYHYGGPFTSKTVPPIFAPYVVKRNDSRLSVFKVDPQIMLRLDTASLFKDDPAWAFLKSNTSESMQALIEASDLGKRVDETQIETWRSTFALGDVSKWKPAHEMIMGVTPASRDYFVRAVGEDTFNKNKLLTAGVLGTLINLDLLNWAALNSVPNLEPVRFKVIFVHDEEDLQEEQGEEYGPGLFD